MPPYMARYSKPEKGDISISNGRVSASTSTALEVVIQHVSRTKIAPSQKKDRASYEIDDMDLKIISNLLAGYSNAEIARKVGKPLSTVQRRTRHLIDRGYVIPAMHLNFKKFGLRRGLLHFKCKSANLQEVVQKISRIKGVESISGYLGSLDVIANVVYADSSEVLGIIGEAQKLDLVADVTWSEEIHSVPI